MIRRITRGAIELEVGGRSVTIHGEAFLRGHGSPDFVAYRDLLKAWDDGTSLTDGERESVIADLLASAKARGMTVEVE
jgi:hypothetical protein